MFKNILLPLCLLFIFNIPIATAAQNVDEKVVIKRADLIKQVVGVDGMTCMGCEITLEKNVSEILGVVFVRASSDEKQMVVQYDKTKTNLKEINKVVKKAGYTPLGLINTDKN